MILNFTEALRNLERVNPGTIFRLMNQARPAGDYLFASLLPERMLYDFQAKSGSMTVRTTMAGLVAMDSPYPESGMTEVSTFSEETAKFANQVTMSEQAQRHLLQMMQNLQVNQQPTQDAILTEIFNFTNFLLVQSHLDLFEWLRGQALVSGMINWTYNKKTLYVDYGIPTENILTERTGTAAWDDSASKFWDDIRLIRKALKGDVRAIIAHSDTIEAIRYNSANNLITTASGMSGVTFQRVNTTVQAPTGNVEDVVTIIPYNKEGEVWDTSNPGQTVKLPFMPRWKLLGIGNNTNPGYQPGMGSIAEDPQQSNTLGYTHLAPTVEAGGMPGRWANVYTPDQEPYKLVGRGVSNGLPVIEAPAKICVASMEAPA
jgi:hypothetical protein